MEIGNTVREAIDGFKLHGELKECIRYGSGHINDTYRLTYETSQGTKRYILQRMSRNIFKKPVELMENISGVTSWLRKKIIENGGRSGTRDTDTGKKPDRSSVFCGF